MAEEQTTGGDNPFLTALHKYKSQSVGSTPVSDVKDVTSGVNPFEDAPVKKKASTQSLPDGSVPSEEINPFISSPDLHTPLMLTKAGREDYIKNPQKFQGATDDFHDVMDKLHLMGENKLSSDMANTLQANGTPQAKVALQALQSNNKAYNGLTPAERNQRRADAYGSLDAYNQAQQSVADDEQSMTDRIKSNTEAEMGRPSIANDGLIGATGKTLKNAAIQLGSAATTSVTKTLSGALNMLRDLPVNGVVGAYGDVYDKDGKPQDTSWMTDPFGKLIQGIDGISQQGDEDMRKAQLQDNPVGRVSQNMIHVLPDIAATALMPEAKAAEAPAALAWMGEHAKAAQMLGKVLTSNFAKLLAVKGATEAYGSARARGLSPEDASVEAAKSGAEGYTSGTTMELAGGIGGKVTDMGMKTLTDAGLVKQGTKILTKAALRATVDAGIFAALPLGSAAVQHVSNLVTGQKDDPNLWEKAKDEAASGAGMGIGFSLLGLMHDVGKNKEQNKHIEDITNYRQGVAVQNFATATPEAIMEAYHNPTPTADLNAKAIEYAEKAKKEVDPEKRDQLILMAQVYAKTSDIQGVAHDVVNNREVVLKSIDESKMADKDKAALSDKVNIIYNQAKGIPNEEPTPTPPTEVPLSETPPQADAGNVPAMAGPTGEAVTKPTEQQVLDDLKNKRFVTFTYDKESDVPNELKDKISSVGEINGKKTVKVTLPQSEADYLLSKKNEPTTTNIETTADVQAKPEQQTVENSNSEAPVETPISDSGEELSHQDAVRQSIEKETDPKKIAAQYHTESSYPDHIEKGIIDYLGDSKINESDYRRITGLSAKDGAGYRWIDTKNSDKTDINTHAEILSHDLGVHVTPEDIVETIDRYTGRKNFIEANKSDTQKLLESRYEELTGKKLTARRAEKAHGSLAKELTPAQVEEFNKRAKEIGITQEDIDNYERARKQSDRGADKPRDAKPVKNKVRKPKDDQSRRTKESSGGESVGNKPKTQSLTEEEPVKKEEISPEPTNKKIKIDPLKLVQPKKLQGSDYNLALGSDEAGKYYIVDTNSGIKISKTYDGKYEALNAYSKNIDKLTPEILKTAANELNKVPEADIPRADENKPITERDKAEEIAQKILSKKAKVKGGNMNSFAKGVGEIVWNGALDAAAAVVRAKGSIHDAINAAVRHIKEHTENKNNREMYYAIRKELQDTGLVEHSDIDYTQELKDASLTQKQLATKGKADDLYKELSEIKPATLTPDEIVHYNNIMNDSKADRSELATFLDDVHARQDEEAQQREKDWYKQLRNDEDLDGEDVKGALSEAAKLPEISPDDTESTIDEKSNISNTKDNNIAKKALSKLLTFGRKELKDTELPSEMDEVKKALLDLDESKLSTKQLRDLNRTIEAMINDHNYAGSGKWLALDQSVKSAADILADTKKRGFEQGKTSQFAADFRSLDQNVEIIAKNTKGASVIQDKSGIQDISAGNAKVNKTMNDISKEFNNLTKGMPKDIQSVDNRYKRGILSLFTQQADTDSAQDHFDRYKEYVSTTAKRLLKSTKKSEQREGQLIQDLYDKYVDKATTSEEVINGLTKDNANNAKIVNFFINKYKSVYPELRKNTLLYGGKDLPSIANYTATSMKMLRGEEDTGEPTFSITNPVSFDADQNVNTDQSRTTITRKKGMGNSRVLNLNFDGLQLNKLRESHYDVQTLASRHLYDAIRNQPDFKEALAGKKNVGVISEGVANMVQRQRGFNKSSPEARAAMQVLNIATAKGVRAALFGIAQPLKQYPSVAINTLLNLGNDIDLYAKSMMRIGQHNPIYDQSGIGLRGGQKGGTEFELKQRQLQNADFENNTIKALSAISHSGDWISNKLSYALSKSDDVVARHSWGAYYMKSLRQQGIDVNKVDWANEHKDINKEAAAYAEQQVSRNQIQNDATKQADFLYNGNVATAKDIGHVVFKGLTMPFSSFARNAQARLESDLRKFSGGDKKEATRSIISGVAEAAAFNTIKYIVIAPLVQAAASSLLTSFGYKKPKEKTLGESAMEIPAQSLNDFMLSGFGQMGDYWTIRGVNGIYSKIKKNPDAQLMKQFDPNVFGDPDFGMAGVYGILPSKIYQAHQEANYVDGSPTELKGAYDADKGSYEYKKVKGHLSNKQTHLAQLTMLVDMLGLMGLSDAEALRINQKIFREIKKQKEPVKTFKKDYINKNSASTYDDE